CGTLQTLLAIYGGLKCGFLIYESCNCKKGDDKSICDSFWCGSITDFNSLLSGGYLIYFLPQWVITNAIISWVVINNKVILPFYVHIMIYMPLLVYPTFIFVGYSIKKAVSQFDYQQI